MNPITRTESGQAEWTHRAGDRYVVTGVDKSGKRFRRSYSAWVFAEGTNLWRGSKWLERDGKRYLISRCFN